LLFVKDEFDLNFLLPIKSSAASMAEALGTFPSAPQIADLAKKLLDFCDAAKDAPKAVEHLVQQAQSLSLQCFSISERADLHPRPFANPANLDECLQLCDSSAVSLRHAINGIDAIVIKHWKLGCYEAALRKTSPCDLGSRLMAARSSLDLAHAILTGYVHHWRLSQIHS